MENEFKSICPIMSSGKDVVRCVKTECELYNEIEQMCAFSRLHQIGEELETIEENSVN